MRFRRRCGWKASLWRGFLCGEGGGFVWGVDCKGDAE